MDRSPRPLGCRSATRRAATWTEIGTDGRFDAPGRATLATTSFVIWLVRFPLLFDFKRLTS